MKKLWIAVLAVIAIGAAAFFISNPGDKKEIVVFLPSADNPFWIEVRNGVETKAAELGTDYVLSTMASGDLDASSQVEQLRSVLSRGTVDAIVIGIASNTAPAPILSEYNKESIPVVLIDTKLDPSAATEAGAKWDAFVGSDNRIGGLRAAEAMAKVLPTGSRVLLIKGSYVHQSAIDRAEGFIEGAGGQLEVVEREGEWSRERAHDLTAGIMTREPVQGIFASNDDMALGAVAALKNLSLDASEIPIVVGFDATPAGMHAIETGDMYASVKQDARGMGARGVELAVDLIEGNEAVEEILIPVNVVPEERQAN